MTLGDEGLAEQDGVEAKVVVIEQLRAALELIHDQNPARITTLGGERSVSVAPFSVLAERYRDDLAVVWIDSHPDVDTSLTAFAPDELRTSSAGVVEWLAGTGCSKVAIHLDVDTIDSREVVFGVGAEPDGLTTAEVRRIIADLADVADVVGLTIAEFFPRQVMHLQLTLRGLPLL